MIRRLFQASNSFVHRISQRTAAARRVRRDVRGRRLTFLPLEERVFLDASGGTAAVVMDPLFSELTTQLDNSLVQAASIDSAASGAEVTALRTFYVDNANPLANDSNPGNASSPWRTIRHAADVALAGDLILVKAGTYIETSPRDDWDIATLNPVNSGTTTQPIVFQAYANDAVTITNDTAGAPAIGVNGRNYVTWQGFTTDREVGVYNSQGIDLRYLNVSGQYVATTDNHDGIRIERSSSTHLQYNSIHGVRGDSWNSAGIKVYTSSNIIVEDNYIYGNTTGIFDKDSGVNNTYRRNYVTNNDLAFQGNNQGQMATFVVYDNVFKGSGSAGAVQLLSLNDGSQVHNNLFFSDTMVGTWENTTDTLRNIHIWDNVLVSSASSIDAWYQGWEWTGHEFGYFDHNIYTATPTYDVLYKHDDSLTQMRSRGYELSSSVVVGNVYDSGWALLPAWQTAGRYGGAVGPSAAALVMNVDRYGPTAVSASSGGAVPADYNGNGVVDDADYLVWRTDFDAPAGTSASADGNSDGAINAADYVFWRSKKPKNYSAQVSIIANDATGSESGDNGQFAVSLSAASAADTVVRYTVGGDATAGTDYLPLAGTVTIPAGSTAATISVIVVDDALVESSETVSVTITGIASGNSGISINGSSATATVSISDNDQSSGNVDFYTGFESSAWQQYFNIEASGTNVQLVGQDAALGFQPLSGQALRVTIPANSHNGADFQYYFADQWGAEPEEAYFTYNLRFASDWNAPIDGKLPGFAGTYWQAGWGGRPATGADGWSARGLFYPTSNGLTRIGNYTYHMNQTDIWGDDFLWNASNATLAKNRWYEVEQYVKLNTPGQANGIMRAWVDGQLAFERTDLEFRSVSNLKIESVWFNVYLGGSITATYDQHLYIDDVKISRQFIPFANAAGSQIGNGANLELAVRQSLASVVQSSGIVVEPAPMPVAGVSLSDLGTGLSNNLLALDSGNVEPSEVAAFDRVWEHKIVKDAHHRKQKDYKILGKHNWHVMADSVFADDFVTSLVS